MSTSPALNALPAPSKHLSSDGTPSRLASSRASSGVTPPGFPAVPFASTMLPRLIEARSFPVGAKSLITSGDMLNSSSCGRDLRVGLIAALEAVGDEAARLHLFDERAQICRRGGPAFRPAHGLAASKDLPAASNVTYASGTPRRLASSRARSAEMPRGPSAPFCASTPLP